MRRATIWAGLALLAGAGAAPAQQTGITVTITADKQDYKNVPVCVPLSLPAPVKEQRALLESGDLRIEGQLTIPGLLTEAIKPSAEGLVRRDLHFILPNLKRGQALTFKVRTTGVPDPPGATEFDWDVVKGEYADLEFRIRGGARSRPVMRYWHRAYDKSTEEARDRTYKVFHHLFDSAGKRIVTNGGQTDVAASEKKKLLYPHHRGLMFAYNRISYGEGQKADTWHAKPGDTHQAHARFAVVEGGPVLGRHRVVVDWHGPKDEVFAKEERELTVYNVPGGTLVQFVTRLRTAGGKVMLDGDPQHAGFQFRAHNDVSQKTAKQTYYLRPGGKGEPGETRNWDPKTKKGPINLPWDAMSFVLDDNRYTVAYLNHPSNPGESRWSERDYGRFGCYFPYELTEDRPLVARYRVWLQDGEMTGPQVEALHSAFTSPPAVKVK
jgi:hypothetical protein